MDWSHLKAQSHEFEDVAGICCSIFYRDLQLNACISEQSVLAQVLETNFATNFAIKSKSHFLQT